MYQVVTLPRSEADFAGCYGYIEQRSPAGAAAWANAFFRALKSLEQNPLAHSLAPEDADHDVEIRQILFRTPHGREFTLPRKAAVQKPYQRELEDAQRHHFVPVVRDDAHRD